MKTVKCENGHMFYLKKSKQCPVCGSENYVSWEENIGPETFRKNEEELSENGADEDANKVPFLDPLYIVSHLLKPIVFLIIWCILRFVPLWNKYTVGFDLLVLMLCIATAIPAIILVVKSSKNLSYLKQNGYYEAMCAETPQPDDDYAVSETFVFSFNRRLCLPIKEIKSFNISGKRYVNSITKSSAQLTIWLNNGDSYCFMLYSGLSFEHGKDVIVDCMNAVLKKNPRIVRS